MSFYNIYKYVVLYIYNSRQSVKNYNICFIREYFLPQEGFEQELRDFDDHAYSKSSRLSSMVERKTVDVHELKVIFRLLVRFKQARLCLFGQVARRFTCNEKIVGSNPTRGRFYFSKIDNNSIIYFI